MKRDQTHTSPLRWTTILVSYFKQTKIWFRMALVMTLIFLFVFYVYSLPLEPIFYASGICALVLLIVISLEMFRYRKKLLVLQGMNRTIGYELASMPEPVNEVEKQYQALLLQLYHQTMKERNLSEQNRSELMEYYTMWVHQAKTPLAAIRLLLQLDDTTKRTELLSELLKVEQYVEMALQYLRIEDMSADLVLKECNLNGLVKQVIRKHASWFISKNITLDFHEVDCTVLSDEKWLSFVFEQLLSNALKYTGQGGTISIYLDASKPNTLVIEDNGIGIAPEDLPRIFEKGFTGQNGRVDRKATGIGLYLVKQIVGKLAHTIAISSRLGVGTKVSMNFDRAHFVIE